MPITAEQRERRKHFLGASDIPAVLGISPFQSAYDIFLQKTQNMAEFDSEAADAGTRFEAPVMDWAEEQLGPIERNVELVSAKLPFLMVHLDGRLVDGLRPVEAKTSGLFYRLVEDVPGKSWGEPGTDQVPDYVAVQAYGQMFAAESEVCFIPAFLGGRGFNLFTIERREDVMAQIIDRCQEFWLEHVMTNTPPDDSYPSLEVVKRIQADDSATAVELPDDLVEEWIRVKDAAKEINAREESLQAMIKALLGPATLGGTATRLLTCKEQTKKAHPVKECTFRVLRLKEPKKTGK